MECLGRQALPVRVREAGSTCAARPVLTEWAVCSGRTVTLPYHLTLQAPENYFYVPDLGQVPEIDVPSYLPDLPGIADDLMYSADLGPGIAPSAPGAIPELPTFNTEVAEPFQPGELGPGIE